LSVDGGAYLEAMALWPTGVTVVTGYDDGPVGFACQSFASVSLEPPLVLFCADHRGRAWPGIRRSGRFTVNVLGEEQDELCQRFGVSRMTLRRAVDDLVREGFLERHQGRGTFVPLTPAAS
jgi:3-hydroxy-9,10-secoandrosta-1,3,5(10)-triene-9,17-dione monooxygenase reductase component